MGRRPARAAADLNEPHARRWPLVVRRARDEDRTAVLSFASTTWDGWDYIPRAWPHWLAADDGVVLVATAGRTADDQSPIDASGVEIELDRPVAVARVAMLAPGEAWLEGIRVDPRMRGLGVATDLQVAELRWAAASGATVVRYATGERNDASHRLGARHGFELLAAFRLWQWHARPPSDEDDEGDDVSGFDDAARAQANAVRQKVLARLFDDGLIAHERDGDAWWSRLSADSTFLAGQRLCEHRGWAMQRLTRELFDFHLARGEVLAVRDGEGWALGTLHAEAPPAEDADVKLGLLVGQGEQALGLVDRVRRLAGQPVGFWLPHPDPPLLANVEGRLVEAGFHPRQWALHVLARHIGREDPVPEPDRAGSLVMADHPSALSSPSFGADRSEADSSPSHRVRWR